MTLILALDLASVTGWAIGEPGGTPSHGSHRFASSGASHEAIFAAAFRWTDNMIAECYPGESLIVWEAPLATSFKHGNSNTNTTTLLYGLPAIVGACAYLRGIFDIRKAETRLVRQHFIGCNPKRARAKALAVCLADCSPRDRGSVAYSGKSDRQARRQPKRTTGLLWPIAHGVRF